MLPETMLLNLLLRPLKTTLSPALKLFIASICIVKFHKNNRTIMFVYNYLYSAVAKCSLEHLIQLLVLVKELARPSVNLHHVLRISVLFMKVKASAYSIQFVSLKPL